MVYVHVQKILGPFMRAIPSAEKVAGYVKRGCTGDADAEAICWPCINDQLILG